MNIRNTFLVLAAFVAASFGAVCAQAQPVAATGQPLPSAAPPTGIAETASGAYVLGRDDVVEVGLLGRPPGEFGGRARVQADGTIQLGLVGKIQAAEHTSTELAETIRDTLKKGGYFADPVVTVEVVGYASRYIIVMGAFGQTTLVPMNKAYRLSEILARVGGVRADAADYVIVTSESGEQNRYKIAELATGGPDKDPYVKAGDKLYAPTAEVFYIYGKVNGPGAFPLRSALTVRQAIAQAGGLGESGSDKKIDVTRGGKKIKLQLDDPVLAGDVLVVGERMF